MYPPYPPPPDSRDRVLISVNPNAGARSAQNNVDRLAEMLKQKGLLCEIHTDLSTVSSLANQWGSEGRLRALVGVGGDGTAAELVNRTSTGIPLTMLPSGNENLLARHFGLGRTPKAVCQTILDGKLLRLDAARAAGRVFLLMFSCGFDAEVVRRVHGRRTGHIRNRDYFKPILEVIRSYEYPELRVYWDHGANESTRAGSPSALVRWLFAFNLPCYGGGLRFAPQADANDGLLDICSFRRGSLWHGLRYAGAVFLRRHQALGDCVMRRAARLWVNSEAEVPYQLDGDPGGTLPVEVETLPGRLTLLVPASEATASLQ